MARPKIELARKPLDWVIEVTGLTVLLAITAIVFSNYGGLPDQIPSHFAASGVPDDYSGKTSILLLWGITVVLTVMMYALSRNPQVMNYSVEITEENAAFHYRRQVRLITSTNTIIVILFAYIIYTIIQTAMSKSNGLGTYFLLVFLLAVFAPLIWYLIATYILRRQKTS